MVLLPNCFAARRLVGGRWELVLRDSDPMQRYLHRSFHQRHKSRSPAAALSRFAAPRSPPCSPYQIVSISQCIGRLYGRRHQHLVANNVGARCRMPAWIHIQVADLAGVIEALLDLGWLDEGEAEDRKAIGDAVGLLLDDLVQRMKKGGLA